MGQEGLNRVQIIEYMVSYEEDISLKSFIDTLNKQLEDKGFKLDLEKASIQESEESIKFSIMKNYHYDKKRKNVFFILEVDYIDENIDANNICKTLRLLFNSEKYKNIRIFQTEIQELKMKKVELIEDKFAYCILSKAYPLIYDIENLLRVLIIKTMTLYAKDKWIEKELPKDITIKDDRKNLGIYGLDFSHLTKMFFDRTEDSLIGNVLEGLLGLDLKDKNIDKKIEKLQKQVPKSNWKKYFSNIVIKTDTIKEQINEYKELSDDKVLEKILYDLAKARNKIAHNNFHGIDYDFYLSLELKVNLLKQSIENAIKLIEENFYTEMKLKNQEKLSPNEKRLIESIQSLKDKFKKIYDLREETNLIQYLSNELQNLEDENQEKINYLKDIRYFISLENKILIQIKSIDNEDIDKNISDIDKLLSNDIINHLKPSKEEDILDDIQFEYEI